MIPVTAFSLQGFSGQFCESHDPCASSPCANGGRCFPRGDGGVLRCECPAGTSGDTCDLDVVNECTSNPCRNGGTCVDGPARFRCLCPAMFYGVRCERYLPDSSTLPSPSGPGCSADCREKAGNRQCDVRFIRCPTSDDNIHNGSFCLWD